MSVFKILRIVSINRSMSQIVPNLNHALSLPRCWDVKCCLVSLTESQEHDSLFVLLSICKVLHHACHCPSSRLCDVTKGIALSSGLDCYARRARTHTAIIWFSLVLKQGSEGLTTTGQSQVVLIKTGVFYPLWEETLWLLRVVSCPLYEKWELAWDLVSKSSYLSGKTLRK